MIKSDEDNLGCVEGLCGSIKNWVVILFVFFLFFEIYCFSEIIFLNKVIIFENWDIGCCCCFLMEVNIKIVRLLEFIVRGGVKILLCCLYVFIWIGYKIIIYLCVCRL